MGIVKKIEWVLRDADSAMDGMLPGVGSVQMGG